MPTLHKIAVLVIGAALLFGLLLMPEEGRHGKDAGAVVSPGKTTASPTPKAAKKGPPPSPGPASAQAASAKANELGEVPVLMYHRIVAKKSANLDRTPGELRAELEALAAGGYVPVTAAEYVQGKIDIPLGKHPVVLTFDDGYPDHIALDAQGAPKPDTAAGVIMDVAARNPGFRPVATFYVIKDPFGIGVDPAPAATWLVQHGFEVANHTAAHPDLSRLSEKKVRKEIGDQQKLIEKLTGGPSITFAYPFGAVPKKTAWVMSGDGWKFQGAFLAGYNPAPSPFDKALDRARIPRIRSMGKVKKDDCDQFCSTAWLAWLEKNADRRYTSDGDPAVITAPAEEMKDLASGLAERARIY